MAVSYNRHRQKDEFSRHLGSKRNFSPKNDPENICVKYINSRCSPKQIHNSNSTSDQKTITITVKKKTTQTKKQKRWKENERVKKSNDTSLITVYDYLKVLAKKCSTPAAHQPYFHWNQKKRRSSDTCLNMSTSFKTKAVVNTVSMDPKKIPPDCKNLLNHPLMQAQLSIYRCQLNSEKNGGCKTCNSTAIFEVVKCLYDCYKKKKCDPCKCVVCGYLPRDIRKLINEVGRPSVSVGVETATTNRKSKSTMTSVEDELLSMLQSEVKTANQFKITASEKLRMAKAFGILTSAESPGEDKIFRAHQRENNADYVTETEPPCPLENISKLEKTLYMRNLPDTGPSLRVPSKKLRKARASGLLTPLDGKTQKQREKMLRHLAMNDIPLPEGKTESEKEVISKVRRELGLPPGPRTAEEKERYAKGQAAGLITPLKGKSQPQKENILRSLLENGIPLPEGRTPLEKALIDKIELECFSKPMTKSDAEKSIKHRAKSYVHTLFNKFANEIGYMVLLETSCVKDKFCNLQVQGFLTPIEVRSPKQEVNISRLTQPKETKSLEKALFKEVEIGVRLIPESQGKTQIRKVVRETGKESVKLRDGQILLKKLNKRQSDSRTPLEERIIKSKGKLLPRTALSGNQLLNSRTTLENPFYHRVKDKARPSNVILEKTGRTKLSKSESEQAKVVKGLPDARLSLAKDYMPLEKENIIKVRVKPSVLQKKTRQTSATGAGNSQKISKGMVTKLISKLVSHINEDLDNTRAGVAKCDRDVGCDTKTLSFRKSYLTIKLSVSDVSNATTPTETRSVFTDTKDIRHTSNIATSLPSIANSNSTVAEETDILDNIPTKEIKKNNKNNFPNDKNQMSCSNSANEDSKSSFCFYIASDTDDAVGQSHGNERNPEENADLIYIYKPTFEYNAKGVLTTSSRIILTESYNISPTTSGSLFLIEMGSTDSYDSEKTDFSYATKETSGTETGTDVFYVQQSEEEYSKDTCSEPRIFWFYRNSIHKNGRLTGRDAKIYLLSEVKMRQQRNELAQRTAKQLNLRKQVVRPAPRQSLRRSSSIFIVMSPSRNQLSSEDLGSLIYVEKLDSVSRLKTMNLIPDENAQKVLNPIKMFRCHTRNEEKLKHSVEPKTRKCPEIRHLPAPHTLPVTNAFTKYPCSKITSNRENRLDYSSVQFQKPRIPPKYSDNLKVTSGHPTWSEELFFQQTSCSTTCRLGVNPKQRIGRSEKQQIETKYLETSPKTIEPARENIDPLCKAITRYLLSTKRPSCQEKRTKWSPNQRLIAKNSKLCLISTAHSSKYSHSSKVSFSDQLKYIRRGKSSESCEEKCLDPNCPKKRPYQDPDEGKNSSNDSLCYFSNEKAKRLQDNLPQFTIKIAPKSSKFDVKTPRSTTGSKVHFDRPLRSRCTCAKTGSQQSDPDYTKDELRPCAHERKAPKKSESDCSKKDQKPSDCKKKTSQQSEKNSNHCENEKNTEQQLNTDVSKTESKPCEYGKKISEQSDSDLSKNELKPCEKRAKKNKKIIDQQPELESTCKTVARELLEEEIKKNPCDLESPGQTSTAKQILTKECCSQCRNTAKRATSPMNVNVKSIGVDGSSTSKPSCSAICPVNDKMPEKPLNICDCGRNGSSITSEDICNRKKPTMDSLDNQPADKNVKLDQPIKSKCLEPISTRDSTMQPTNECVKQQIESEQFCPPNSNPDSTVQPPDVCVKLNQQVASECPASSTENSISQSADENVKLNQQMIPECPANSIQDSVPQPSEDNAKLCQQMESECPAHSTEDSVAQFTDDNAKLSQQMASECPANSIQDSVAQFAEDNANLCQQVTAECPAKGTLDSKTQPLEDVVNQNIPCQNPVENNKSEQLVEAIPDPPATSSRKTIIHEQLMQQTDSNSKPCDKDASGNKEKNHCRYWWCKNKRILLRRRNHPAPPHSVEENSMETQCERDVRDLAQMTDDLLLQMTHEMMEMRGDLEQCLCGDTVKPCQCLNELAQTMMTGGVTITKPTSECECPPPILILKGHQQEHYEKEENILGEQQSHCSCITFQKNNMLHRQQTIVNQNITEVKGLSQMSKQQANAPYIYSMNDLCHSCCKYKQHKTPDGANETIGPCECGRSTTVEQTAGDQNNNDGTYQGMMSDGNGKKKIICGCPRPKATGQTVGGQNVKDGTCLGMMSGSGSKKNINGEQPPLKTRDHRAGGEKRHVPTCQGMPSGPGGKKNSICECPPLISTEQAAGGGQYGKDGTCHCMTPGPGGKKNITCKCPRPTTARQMTAGQTCKAGRCQGMSSGPGSAKTGRCECPRPTTLVKEQTTPVQCKKGEQRSCNNHAKVESDQSKQSQDPNMKSGRYKKTVICESPSKDKFQVWCPGLGKAPCQKTVTQRKKNRGHAGECSSSDDGTECQNKKTLVKWCKKKYVISECPPLSLEDHRDPVCLSKSQRKKQKKNAKNQAEIKTAEKKVDTSCTHGATPCMCKDEPFCLSKKNHKCECPCPLFVEEVDLTSEKDCPPEPPCPKDCPPTPPSCLAKVEKKNQKKSLVECDQEQMTEDKVDKCSYTDRLIKNICKTKNKSSGQGKWRKKKALTCICPPEPPTTERGCDPPCVKEQWRMRSRETCSKSGFSFMKKPAPRVDLTMCFEEALAYFEQHPEDDPMQKKKKKLMCECPPSDCCNSFESIRSTLPYCISRF